MTENMVNNVVDSSIVDINSNENARLDNDYQVKDFLPIDWEIVSSTNYSIDRILITCIRRIHFTLILFITPN